MLKVYVATALSNWQEAKKIGEWLAEAGMVSTSSWVKHAETCGSEAASTNAEILAAHKQNYSDLAASDAILIVRREEHPGGEMFIEFVTALDNGQHVVWVGRPILTALRANIPDVQVKFCRDVDQAIEVLKGLETFEPEVDRVGVGGLIDAIAKLYPGLTGNQNRAAAYAALVQMLSGPSRSAQLASQMKRIFPEASRELINKSVWSAIDILVPDGDKT